MCQSQEQTNLSAPTSHPHTKWWFTGIIFLLVGIVLGAGGFSWFSTFLQGSPTTPSPIESPRINGVPAVVPGKPVIISPQAEEDWYANKKVYTIRWTAPAFKWGVNSWQKEIKSSDNVRAFLFLADAESPKKYVPVFIGETSYESGGFVWAIPHGPDSGAYLNELIMNRRPVQVVMVLYPAWLSGGARDISRAFEIAIGAVWEAAFPGFVVDRDAILPGTGASLAYVVSSSPFKLLPTQVGAELVTPSDFKLGAPQEIRWHFANPGPLEEFWLNLMPFDPKFSGGTLLNQNESEIDYRDPPFAWDGLSVYGPVGPGWYKAEIAPGKYRLQMSFRAEDGYSQVVNSDEFNILSPSATDNSPTAFTDTTGWRVWRVKIQSAPVLEIEFRYPNDWRAENFYYIGSRFPERANLSELPAGVDLIPIEGNIQDVINVFGSRASMDTSSCEERTAGGVYGGDTKCFEFSPISSGWVRTRSQDPKIQEIFEQVVKSIKVVDKR